MYKFVYCQTHPKCPDVKGWYLVLRPGDLDTLFELHRGVCRFFFFKFGLDPHLKKSELSAICNPIKLAEQWLTTIQRHLSKGKTAVVNSSTGWLPFDSVTVLVTEESRVLFWPDRRKGERITISRWPGCRHYYLSSNKNRLFIPGKYIRYQDALEHAERYTDKVDSKNC